VRVPETGFGGILNSSMGETNDQGTETNCLRVVCVSMIGGNAEAERRGDKLEGPVAGATQTQSEIG